MWVIYFGVKRNVIVFYLFGKYVKIVINGCYNNVCGIWVLL